MGLLQVGLRAPFTGISKKEGGTYLHRLRDSRNLGLPFPFNKIDLHSKETLHFAPCLVVFSSAVSLVFLPLA